MTGIAAAYMDSVPLVALTGNVPRAILGKDNFQEVDIAGITMPVTKYSFIVKTAAELERTLVRAFEIAESGRKGPVLVDLPYDVLTASATYLGLKKAPDARQIAPEADLCRAEELMARAESPLVLVGGGCLGAREAVGDFLRRSKLPAVCTMAGVAALPGELRLGMVGAFGDPAANEAVAACDCLLALGTRFSDRVTEALPDLGERTVIHVDLDRAELGKNVIPGLAVLGDAGDFVSRLRVARTAPTQGVRTAAAEAPRPPSQLAAAIRGLSPALNLVTDVGFHQVNAARFFPFAAEDSFLSSMGLGAMGYGLGAAIGGYLANGKPTVLVTGDGSFRMNFCELITVRRLNLPIAVIVHDNRSLGMVKRLQRLKFGGRVFETDGIDTDFAKLAESLGIPALRTENLDEIRAFLAAHRGSPVVIDYLTEDL